MSRLENLAKPKPDPATDFMYDGFSKVLDKHGSQISKKYGKVVSYEFTDTKKRILIDMKSK